MSFNIEKDFKYAFRSIEKQYKQSNPKAFMIYLGNTCLAFGLMFDA